MHFSYAYCFHGHTCWEGRGNLWLEVARKAIFPLYFLLEEWKVTSHAGGKVLIVPWRNSEACTMLDNQYLSQLLFINHFASYLRPNSETHLCLLASQLPRSFQKALISELDVSSSHTERKCFKNFLSMGDSSCSPFSCGHNAASQSFSLFQIFHVNVVCVVKSLLGKGEPDLWHGP